MVRGWIWRGGARICRGGDLVNLATIGEMWRALYWRAFTAGWNIRRGPFKTLSVTLPWRTIWIARNVWPDLEWRTAVAAHELRHADRAEAFTGGPWFWTAWYLISPWARRLEELEAEAAEAVMRTRLRPGLSLEAALSAENLGGWRAPYFMGGDPTELRRLALEAARRQLEEL